MEGLVNIAFHEPKSVAVRRNREVVAGGTVVEVHFIQEYNTVTIYLSNEGFHHLVDALVFLRAEGANLSTERSARPLYNPFEGSESQ